MHRRTIHGLTLAALFAISSEMARADEQVVIVAKRRIVCAETRD